jgi:hypothetical protein
MQYIKVFCSRSIFIYGGYESFIEQSLIGSVSDLLAKGISLGADDRELKERLKRIVSGMMAAKDRVARGEIAEGCEVSSNGFRFYVGRYFGQIGSMEMEGRSNDEFRQSVPILPYIVSFQVGRMPDRKRPILSIICTICLDDILTNFSASSEEKETLLRDFGLGRRPNSEIGKEISGLELKLARMDVNLDLYRFTELYYVVLSMPVDVRKPKEVNRF